MSKDTGIKEIARIRQDGETYLFASPGGDRFVEVVKLPQTPLHWNQVVHHVEKGTVQSNGRRSYPLTVTKRYLSQMAYANGGEFECDKVRL